MNLRSFLLQWLLNLVVLFAVAVAFDLVFGETEPITSGRRVAWLLITSLIFAAMSYKKKDAKNIFCSRSLKFSKAKAEKVVKPPQKPVAHNSLEWIESPVL